MQILKISIMIAILIILVLSIVYFSLVILNYQNKRKHNITRIAMATRIETTKELLSMIDDIINVEVINQLKTTIYTQKLKYDYRKLDDDIKEISLRVYNGISPDVFLTHNNDILIQNEYIMAYTTRKTSLVLIDLVISYNSNFMDI